MIPIKIKPQPDDSTCGPTSLHAVYKYYGDKIGLKQVISEVSYLDEGGTHAVFLGSHALKRGYSARIYTYNLKIFDPSWFLNGDNIKEKLRSQLRYKKDKKLQTASKAYIEFLELGGEILNEDLTPLLLKRYFHKNIPILTGLSATYLYQSKREYADDLGRSVYDDIIGYPMGHFVVLCGYDEDKKHVLVADPYIDNNIVKNNNYYSIKSSRIINAIMLGIVTYDSKLLIIQPK